jgi:hypothetical protein
MEELDYTSTLSFLQSLPSHVAIAYNNIIASRQQIIRLCWEEEDVREEEEVHFVFVHRIIGNYLRRRYRTATIPSKRSSPPKFLRHPDPFLNMLQGADEAKGLYFTSYRRRDLRVDFLIHFEDGEERYTSELLTEHTYDAEALRLITPYLKRGYFLPYLLQLYAVASRRLYFLCTSKEWENFQRFYYPSTIPTRLTEDITLQEAIAWRSDYLLSWVKLYLSDECTLKDLNDILQKYQRDEYCEASGSLPEITDTDV